MTNTNEGNAENQGEPGEKNSLFGFLTELTKSPVLFIFTIGAVGFIFAISGTIPGVGKVPNWGVPLLLLVSLLLMYISVKDHRRTVKLQTQGNTYREDNARLHKQLQEEQNSRKELNEAVNKALELLEKKDSKDQADSEILQILREKTVQLLHDLQGSPDQKLIADWINRKDIRSRLIDSLRSLDYAFLANVNERDQFFADIDAHLNLLSKNLRTGGYRRPKIEGLRKSVNNSFAYVQAFQDLKNQILNEAEKDRITLKPVGIDYLREHIDTFIRIINA
jgi:hypothetical protein